jgi:hypothetical protein
MRIKPVLVPDHTANDLRRLMDSFAEASTGPTRQQLTESRSAVTAAQKTINEGFMDTVKQAFNDCVVGYPQGTSDGQFIQGWARAIRAETGRDIPLEKLTRLYQDYAERSDEIMQSHGTTNESEHNHDHDDEEGETCPECDGAGCPECYGDEDRDRAYDRSRGMERESAGMAEMWGNPYDDDKVDAINAANPPKRSTPYTPPSTPAKHHTYDRNKAVAANISGEDSAAYDRFTGRDKDMAEATGQQLNIQQLATISDEALDNAYHYGRSTPGNTFGWQANLKSAAYAKQMIDQGVTDIEAISDAIHKGWNVTARAFVQNPEQFSDTEKLQAAGKLEAKLQQREKLMNIGYAQLPDEEQEKDRVVARALLQALKGQPGVAEGSRDREDDERHDLDPSDWYIVKDGKLMKASVYPNQHDQARAEGFSPTREQARARAANKGMDEGVLGDIGDEIAHGAKGLKRTIQGKPSRQAVKDKYRDRSDAAYKAGDRKDAKKNADRWERVHNTTNSGMVEGNNYDQNITVYGNKQGYFAWDKSSPVVRTPLNDEYEITMTSINPHKTGFVDKLKTNMKMTQFKLSQLPPNLQDEIIRILRDYHTAGFQGGLRQYHKNRQDNDLDETADGVKYGVFAKGGSVGSQRFRDDPLKTFDTKKEAIIDARRRRSALSKGERGYYRMGYVVKPIKGDVEEGMIDNIKNTVRAANYDRLARRSNSQAVAGGGFAPPAQFKSLSAKGDQRAQKAQDIRKGSAEQVDEKSEAIRHGNNSRSIYHVDESVDPVEQLRADIKRFAQ